MTICPCCGQPVIPDDTLGELTPIQRVIVDRIRRRGRATGDDLRDAVWGHDPNGGPGHHTIYAHVWNLNRRLAPLGLRVRASRWSGYRIEEARP